MQAGNWEAPEDAQRTTPQLSCWEAPLPSSLCSLPSYPAHFSYFGGEVYYFPSKKYIPKKTIRDDVSALKTQHEFTRNGRPEILLLQLPRKQMGFTRNSTATVQVTDWYLQLSVTQRTALIAYLIMHVCSWMFSGLHLQGIALKTVIRSGSPERCDIVTLCKLSVINTGNTQD